MRYYEPILDDVPGVQCQVDPGELRGVLIGGEERTLHFVVFVLSYSRLMYVGLAFRPLDTQTFIQLHDEALRYFGGLPEECVYDQTKLVVINEQYRELTLNQRFHEYATTAGFRIHACEGYDPESKGKVEAGVKYVKQDCLYGEVFRDQEHVRQHVQDWVESVANVRIHGTTGEPPRERFKRDEREHLEAYLSPACVQPLAHETRRADKTGLIAWKANKYSVPMAWQQARVGVLESDGQLHISDLNTGDVIASHALCSDKGKVVKNTHHYRDHAQRVSKLESDIDALIGNEIGHQLCQQLKRSEPKILQGSSRWCPRLAQAPRTRGSRVDHDAGRASWHDRHTAAKLLGSGPSRRPPRTETGTSARTQGSAGPKCLPPCWPLQWPGGDP